MSVKTATKTVAKTASITPARAATPIALVPTHIAVERIAKPGLYPDGKVDSINVGVLDKKPAVLPLEMPSPSELATEQTLKAAGQLYVVQIGSFLNRENADKLKINLEKKGLDPYVHLYNKKNNRWFSVRMNYRSRQSAERMAQVVREEIGIPTRVIDLYYE